MMSYASPTLDTSIPKGARVYNQWQVLRQDKWLFSSLTWVPVALCLCMYWIFSQGIVNNLPIGVVDLDKTQLSQTLVQHYNSTSMLEVNRQFDDIAQAKRAMVGGEIYAILYIPHRFSRSIAQTLPPQVTLFYNSQFLLMGKLINSAAQQAQGTFNAKVSVVKSLAKGNTTSSAAAGRAVSVRTQITPLLNKGTNYAQFLVTAIVPAIWQICIVALTILVLNANYRIAGIRAWLDREKVILGLSKTLAPYFLWFWFLGACFLIWFYYLIGWPMEGSWAVLLFAQMLTTLTCMIMGCFFFFLTCDPARAMSFAGAFTAPGFAFMGITFPATDMGSLAQLWRGLLPASHYIEVQISQASEGANVLQSLALLIPMWGYIFPLILTVFLIKKHRDKELIA